MPRRRVVHHPKVIYVHIEADAHMELRRLVTDARLTMSDVVRDLIHQYLRSHAARPAVAPKVARPHNGASA